VRGGGGSGGKKKTGAGTHKTFAREKKEHQTGGVGGGGKVGETGMARYGEKVVTGVKKVLRLEDCTGGKKRKGCGDVTGKKKRKFLARGNVQGCSVSLSGKRRRKKRVLRFQRG